MDTDDDTFLSNLIEENNVLNIYLSPIALYPDTAMHTENHSLILTDEKIDYEFVQNGELPEWHVNNNYFTVNNNGITYILNDFHAHFPAEHTINDVRHAVEIHFVFTEFDNEINNLVIGYIFKLGNRTSSMMRRLLNNKKIRLPTVIDDNFVTYNGSLTKINLEDIHAMAVNWNILTKIKHITQEDLDLFLIKCRGSSIIREDNGRNVTFVNKCKFC